MKNKFNLLKAFGVAFLFVLLGCYILKNSESIIGYIIGCANVFFFSCLIVWGIYKLNNDPVYPDSSTDNRHY